MSETRERVFSIDGHDYPIPTLASFSMDEAVVFYTNNGYPVEDLWHIPEDGDDQSVMERLEKLRSPAVVKTLLHVAYRRAHPGVTDNQIARVTGEVPLVAALAAFIPDQEDEVAEVPLERTSEPSASSKQSSLGSSESSGSGSTTGSGTPGSRPRPTGTIRSGTSRTSDHAISAA